MVGGWRPGSGGREVVADGERLAVEAGGREVVAGRFAVVGRRSSVGIRRSPFGVRRSSEPKGNGPVPGFTVSGHKKRSRSVERSGPRGKAASYSPTGSAVPSALAGLTSLFGMERGGPRRHGHLDLGYSI